jgi:hypothetical protein
MVFVLNDEQKTMDSQRTLSKIERDQAAVLLGSRPSAISPRSNGSTSMADRAGSLANDDAVEGERQEMQVRHTWLAVTFADFTCLYV